jgi:hypothetical protein
MSSLITSALSSIRTSIRRVSNRKPVGEPDKQLRPQRIRVRSSIRPLHTALLLVRKSAKATPTFQVNKINIQYIRIKCQLGRSGFRKFFFIHLKICFRCLFLKVVVLILFQETPMLPYLIAFTVYPHVVFLYLCTPSAKLWILWLTVLRSRTHEKPHHLVGT